MRLPHVIPFTRCPIYFFTFCTAGRRPILANATTLDCLREIWTNSAVKDGWFVGRFMLMPDHVHFFASPTVAAKTRSAWLKTVKGISARRLCDSLQIDPPVWQADSFDHIMRGAESYSMKWDYVGLNPVRAQLVEEPADWPWQGEIHALKF